MPVIEAEDMAMGDCWKADDADEDIMVIAARSVVC
jgi:hypothetical protein